MLNCWFEQKIEMKKYLEIVFALVVAVWFAGCKEDEQCTLVLDNSGVDSTYLVEDIAILDAYLADSGIVAVEDPSGLRYVIDVEGAGATPELCDQVIVNYTGTYLSGRVFDEGDMVTLSMNSIIRGWQIGLLQFNAGTEARLFIPSALGYGGSVGSLPANSLLIFDIKLVSIKP